MFFYYNIYCSASWLKFIIHFEQTGACYAHFFNHCDKMSETNNKQKENTYLGS